MSLFMDIFLDPKLGHKVAELNAIANFDEVMAQLDTDIQIQKLNAKIEELTMRVNCLEAKST